MWKSWEKNSNKASTILVAILCCFDFFKSRFLQQIHAILKQEVVDFCQHFFFFLQQKRKDFWGKSVIYNKKSLFYNNKKNHFGLISHISFLLRPCLVDINLYFWSSLFSLWFLVYFVTEAGRWSNGYDEENRQMCFKTRRER